MIASAEEFVRLRTSQEPADYHRAAHEPAGTAIWLEVIARYPGMKPWVAHNKTVPLEILRVLAEDADHDVRFAVATKRKLDGPLFDRLSRDRDEGVRARIARNPNTPAEIRRRLMDDPSPLVAEAARETA
ncbi:hypothetical protein [Caulobacter sp. CCG-8]|uniref:hypothetical protein n=1 Tax=Caulobacter sp. CCG-8 TaxID=3127958 RepID=UPI00307DC1D6